MTGVEAMSDGPPALQQLIETYPGKSETEFALLGYRGQLSRPRFGDSTMEV